MDEKVLKGITVLLFLLTIAVCGAMVYLPGVHEKAVLAAESIDKINDNAQGKMDATTLIDNPEEVVEEEAISGQLSLELPAEVKYNQVKIENDYLTQTVYISLNTNSEDYFSDYKISGSSNHISTLSYYRKDDTGIIAIETDKVYIVDSKFDDGKLYMDFLNTHDVYDKVVVVDAGHGGRAAGAVKLKVQEKNIDLDILLQLKDIIDDSEEEESIKMVSASGLLEDTYSYETSTEESLTSEAGSAAEVENADDATYRIGVFYTRTDDSNPTLTQRAALANKADADLFISIHNNSSSSGNFSTLNGTQVMYSESDDRDLSSKKLASIMLENVSTKIKSRKIGLLKGDSIYIIRTSEAPVALIEVGFMTNRTELKNLQDEDYQKKAASGIYQGMLEAFEEGY